MDTSANLNLPYIMAAQAQKHVTHNDSIRALDALVQISVIDRNFTAPPPSPNEGDRYIPATGATGTWAGKDGVIAAYQDGAWMFYPPQSGWIAYVIAEARLIVFAGSGWQNYNDSSVGGISTVINSSVQSATTRFDLTEEEIALAGSSVDSTIIIPDRAIVFAVTARTTEVITGAASYDCGIVGDTAKFGSGLGIANGSTNSGVIGPTAFYADTNVRISANGGNFTSGKVRIAIHHLLCNASTS